MQWSLRRWAFFVLVLLLFWRLKFSQNFVDIGSRARGAFLIPSSLAAQYPERNHLSRGGYGVVLWAQFKLLISFCILHPFSPLWPMREHVKSREDYPYFEVYSWMKCHWLPSALLTGLHTLLSTSDRKRSLVNVASAVIDTNFEIVIPECETLLNAKYILAVVSRELNSERTLQSRNSSIPLSLWARLVQRVVLTQRMQKESVTSLGAYDDHFTTRNSLSFLPQIPVSLLFYNVKARFIQIPSSIIVTRDDGSNCTSRQPYK